MTIDFHPLVDVARRFAIDWINRADESVPPTIMTSDYRVHIGETELVGLDAYSGGTVGQLRQFPGLALTVHDLITDGDRLALVFTEHGTSAKNGAAAAWAGVALFRWDGARLTENWTQEDYYARRRQLAGSAPDLIRTPAAAPWTTTPADPSPAAESAARKWLTAPVFEKIFLDDGLFAPAVSIATVQVSELFSAGEQVAFAATWTGDYTGGLDDVPDPRPGVTLGAAGVLTVRDGSVVGGTVVSDRLGLRRRLLPPRQG